MTTGKDKLQFRSNHNRLGIAQSAWKSALHKTVADPIVGIRHAVIDDSTEFKFKNHVAAIPDRVGCHFHAHDEEYYAVVKGHGMLYWGKAEKIGDDYTVPNPEEPIYVQKGDSFTIPEGYAHQLKNDGDGELVIVFSCPDTHLDDKADRTMLPPLAPQ